MTIGGNLQLINQICAKSGLQGKDLENLRTNLQNLSKQELEAELVSLLVAGRDDSNKGLQVEQSASLVLLENYQKTYYYDKKGNLITEYKDGDYVIERIIKGKDEEGNEIETTITYRNNRPRTKVVNKNGKREEVSTYTYHDKSDTNFIPSVTVETTKADNTVVKSEVLEINGYNGDFDLTKVTERETTKPDGTITTITKILNILIEEQKRPDGTILTTYYNGTDIEACDKKQLHKVRQTLKKQNRDIQELYFDGEGNTIVTVNAGDGWERLAKRFHTTEKKLKELNPKIKNLKAGQDILVPNEFDIESKEIGRVQPRDEAIVQAWNAEVDRQIAQKVTENVSKEDAQELKKAGVKPIAENYIFYERFSKLNPSQKQNVLSMIKYYKAQGVTDLNEIKTKILETYPDVNLFDSGKLIRFYQNNNMGIGYIDRFNPQQKGPIALETFITDILKLNLKTEPGKTVYERMASIPQDKLDNFNASNIGAMTGSSFENIANCFLTAGINIFTESEYQLEMMMRTSRKTETEKESEIRAKTVDFAYQLVHKARLQLDAYLAEIKDHYIKNFGTIVWEGLKAIPTMLLPDSWTSGSGEYEALVKNISVKSANLYVLEGDILRLKSNVNSADFETQYKKLLKTDYNPDKIQTLMTLAQNQPDKNSPDYSVYEKQMEKAIKDVTGKDFTQNVSSFINWSKGAGSLVETAIFCYFTAGMGEVISVGGQTARAVTVAGKTFTTATRGGAAMVMATNFGRYAAVRAGLNFIDDIDNLLAPMTLEERLRGRKDLTLGGMFVGENNADQIRDSLSAIKNWATGKITRDEADKIIKKSFKNLSFDDFVSSNGGQWVLNTVTSSIFGAAAGYASPWFQKAGEIGTKWGQRLGLNAPNIQEITADLLTKNPAGINAAEFMAKTYEALHATNIAGKGLQFLVETAVFYCTNLPLSLIQETLSESNGELEQAIKEDRLGSYLIGRFGDEALNLLKVKSIGTIIAMMMGTTNIAQIKENFEDYDVLKNTTIRYEDATIQNPDGTFTSGKAVVLEGPTGKLYVDGSSAKFYTAQGQLVVSENIGAQAQFLEMNEGVKTTFLLGKFMQIERYVKSLSNPIEDAVDLSMPYKPSSQEQQLQQTIDGLTEIRTQQQTTPAQAVVTPITQQQSTTNPTEQAVEIPINQPVKNPYEKPSMSVVDMSPQQMVAASQPQQPEEQQVLQTPATAPLTDGQKTELHERLQQIAQAYAGNNYANIEILRNLTDEERKEFVDNILHLGSGKLHDDYDFLFFANGEKPSVLLGGLSETPEPYLDKLKSDNIDVFHRVVTFGNGQKRNNTLLINKQMTKRVIEENKELFQKRLGLSENSTVDEIYEKMISEDSILKDHEESSDLTGLILGYPKYNTMIFRLDKWIEDHSIMTPREMRINPDIDAYKNALRQALFADDSPYKDMSAEFKNTLLGKINEIKEVTPSRVLFNNDADGYVFNYTTPEPEELVRIEQSMSNTADKTEAENKYIAMSYNEITDLINEKLQTPQNVSDLMELFNALKVKAPRDFKEIKDGSVSFYDSETKRDFNLVYDEKGNIIKYSISTGWDKTDYYIYDKKGKLTKVNEDDYYKVKVRTPSGNELLDYILTHPEILPEETRRLILQDDNHSYSKEDIDELSSLLKTQENIDIANKLLTTKGNESKYIRVIGDALNLSMQKFGVKDIIKVLKSEDAKANVLDHIRTDSYTKKTELEPLLPNGEKFEGIATYDIKPKEDLSYKTKEIQLDVICTDLPAEYLDSPQVREQIDSQVPIGEAACINGEMYCRTENGLVPIHMTKETFDKLFPVEERYNIKQGRIGDCWFIAELGGYMASPNGRATLYSLFRQEGNDIYIKFPSNPNLEIKFENGDLNKLFPISIYKHQGSWKLGRGDAHVQACKGIQMIEQALSFVRDNYTDEQTTITATDKFQMNKQMQMLDGSHIGGSGGTYYLGNDEVISCYTSIGIILDGAKSPEETLEILANEVDKSSNVFGSVSFYDTVSVDVNEEIVSGHQYRIIGYDKDKQLVLMVNPHDSSKYMEIPLEYFKKARPNISVYKISSGLKSSDNSVSGITEQTPITNNPDNLTQINTPQEAGQKAQQALAQSKHRIATAGYSQNPPAGYEETAKTFLAELENELGDKNTAYVTSPTTRKGSIDAITTEVEGLGDNSLFYTTAQNYLSYIGSDNTDINTQAFQQTPKYVLPDAKSYSEATAAASNTFIAIGGKNTTVSDFVNAIKYGNKAVILDSAILDTPAWDSENNTVGNASKYIAEQIQAVREGKPLPYPEVEGFTADFIKENLDKLDESVKIIKTDGRPSSLRIAARQAAAFLEQEADQGSPDTKVVVQQNTNVLNTLHGSYVQVVMQPIKEIANKLGFNFNIENLEQTVNSLSLEALKNIADKRSGDEVDWDGLTKEKITEIQKVLQDNGFNDDIHLLMFLYANGDADVKLQRLKDRKDVLPVGTSKDELAKWIKIMNMYNGEYHFYLNNNNHQEETIPQEKPDWLSFKTDRTSVTRVLLNEIKDRNEYENFKARKGYETDEDAIIPFINTLRKTDYTFKLSSEAKKVLDDFVKKYDIEQFMSDAQIDSEYITNYKQTSYRYTSKHEMAYHDLTNKIFDIRRKFNLDEEETFDLDKLNQTLENLPTETLNDLRRIFYEKHIKTKEEALNILNIDFSKLDIASIKSMLEDNDCYSDYALAQFVFATPEEFANIHKKLVTRKDDLPTCEYESQKETWTQIMEMSDEDYNYYRSMQGSYPEGMDIKDLPIYRRLMQEAPEFTNELVGMKKKKYDFFGDDVPRFTIDEIAQLYETTKTDKEFTMELINHRREKGGLVTTGYVYNEAKDIIKIVELTKTYDKEDVRNLALNTIYRDARAIKVLLELKQSDPELYKTYLNNEYPTDDLDIIQECLEKNSVLTKELMQDKSLSARDIKALVDCNKKYFSISVALSEQIDKHYNGSKEDRFYTHTKVEYSDFVLECTDEQREVFEELLTAKNPDGTYRYDKEIIALCKLYEKDSNTFEALASLKLTNPDDGRVFYATEDIITEMFYCYREDKDATLQVIKNYPFLNGSDMRKLYDLFRTSDKKDAVNLMNMRNENDTSSRFSVEDIKKLIQLKKEHPQEFEEMINAKTLENGRPVYAYKADTIDAYINTSQDYIKHLKSLTTTDKDGNEYKLLSGQQIADINVVYNIICSEPVGDIDMFNEIVYNPKYKFLLQILNKETAPFIGNPKVLDVLDKYGIENAKGVILTKQESDGQRLLVLNMENEQKTINLKADKDGNVTVIGEEVSKKREDSNRIRHNFEDGSYLVEEIEYRDFTSGEGKKLKIASNTKKTWYDSDGIQTRSEVMTPVEGKPGEYTINVYERGLNQPMVKQTIGSVKIEENDEGQITRIEKTLTSPDGTVTKQTKMTEEDGSTSATYEITGVENGENKVLFSQRRSHVKLDENHYTSSLNGQIYDMKFSEEGITVSKLDDEGNPSETITLGSDIIDQRLIPMLKKLPGDVFFLIHKIGITRIYVDESIKKNAQYIGKTIRISPDLMNSPFTFMHELYHGVSDNMFNGVSKNKDYNETYEKDLANYQAQSSSENERIIDYFSTRYHGIEGKEETFAEIGAIVSGVEETQEGSDMLGMRSLVVQQNMARTIVQEMNMVEEGMTKPLPDKPPMTSTGVTMITSPDRPQQTTSPQGADITVSSQDSTVIGEGKTLSKSEFLEKINLMDKYFDEIIEHEDDNVSYDIADNWDNIKNNAYEIYKQNPEIFNILFEGKDFNGNPLPEKVIVYLMHEAFISKNIKNPVQLRNIIVSLSLYEHTEDMKYSAELGISEKDFNLLKLLEKSRSDVQGDWRFDSGAPSAFNEVVQVLTMDLNEYQKEMLSDMLKKDTMFFYDMPELKYRFASIKTKDDMVQFEKLYQDILSKMPDNPRGAFSLADKITTPEMKALADKLIEVFEGDMQTSRINLDNIMKAAHMGAYEIIVELLQNPTKDNKEAIRYYGIAADNRKDIVQLLEQSGILKDHRFIGKSIHSLGKDELKNIIDRDLLSPEKNYTYDDIIKLANEGNDVYNKIMGLDLMKDFNAADAQVIVNNLDKIQKYDLLKYRKVLTADTMNSLCTYNQLREYFLNYPQIQKLGPLGANAINEIINANEPGMSSPQRKKVHDFGRELCDDVELGKLNKYDCEKLYSNTEVANLEFVRDIYENSDKYGLTIGEIIDIAAITRTEENIPIARRLIDEPSFPNNLIKRVLRCADEDNMDILEKTCFDPEFPKEYIRDILNHASKDKSNAKAINSLLDNPDMKQWFIMNLKNDLDLDLIINLARTQKKLNIEAQQTGRVRRSDAPQQAEAKGAEAEEAKPQDVQDAIDKMVSLGMDKNMADKAYVKLCQDKGGNIDKVKLNAVLALVETFGISSYYNDKGKLRTNPNIFPKDIQEILAFAVGSPLSNANGQFRPDIVKDIIALRQAGITDVKLATTISCIKNMGLVEMKDRFNTKVREDAVKRIEELPYDVKSAIEAKGIDLTLIIEKASAEAKGGKVKRVNLESVTLRSLEDIYGDERILITKHKNDKDFDQKIWGDQDKFREWAEQKIADLMDFDKNPEFTTSFGNAEEINAERKQRIKDWYNYLTKESDYQDDPFVHLLILEEITKDLKSDNAATPKPVSPALFNEVHDILINENNNESFDTIYAKKMREKAISLYSHGVQTVDGIEGQWVTIPRTQKGEPNYDEHVAMVQALAEGSSWCLKASNANGYIRSGNIHYFIDKDGKAQVAMHEENGEITQIQKRYKQDSSVPVPYVEVIEQYYKDNNLHGLKSSIQAAKDAKPEFDKLKEKLTKLMDDKDYLAVFKELGFKVTVQDNGTYVLSEYKPLVTSQYSLSELGVDEDKLMANVSGISSAVNLDGSGLTEMKNLKFVKGKLTFGDNQISDLRSLEKVDGQKISWIKPQQTTSPQGNNDRESVNAPQEEGAENGLTRIDTTQDETKKIRTKEQTMEILKRIYNLGIPPYIQKEIDANIEALNQMPLEDFLRVGFPGAYVIGLAKNWKPEFNNLPFDKIPSINQHYASHITQAYVMSLVKNSKQAVFKEENNVVQMGQDGENGTIKFFDFNSLKNSDGTYDINKVYTYLYDTYRSKSTEGMFTPIKTLISAIGLDFTHKFINANKEFFIKFMQTLESGMSNSSQLINMLKQLNSQKITEITEIINKGVFNENIRLDELIAKSNIYQALKSSLPEFDSYDKVLQNKIINLIGKYNNPMGLQLGNLFKGILAYSRDLALVEKICDNPSLLSGINKNAQTVVKLFAHHKNIDKDIRNKVYFNLLLMRYFYPENYSTLTHSKGYQQILTGGLSVAILKNLKYNDNIDADYFYNLFDKLEHTAEQTVSNSDELKQYPENHIKSAIELDPSRQDEILGWIKNAKNPTLMAQTLQIVNNTRARFNRNIDYAENQGNYVNPNELKQENNYLIDFIKIVSENPEMASILGRFCSYKEISLFNSKLLKANLDKNTQDTLLTLFAANPDKLNGQVAINLVEFVSKAPNKIDLIRKILEKGDSQWLTFISENNADYIEDKMDNSEYGSITFIQTLMLTLAKDMPEMKDKNNWQRIEDCAYLLLEDAMNEYYTGYDKIRDEYKPKIDSAENPQKRRRFNNEFAGRINTLRATIRNKIRFMSGVLDMYVNSPEKYEQVKNSGFLDMVKQGKLHPMSTIMLNRNSNLSDNLYSDLETVKTGKSTVPEFPEGTSLDEAFSQTKPGDAVEVGSKMYINDGKQLVEWQMTKETFLKLFPPVERYTTLQGNLGDCYLVSSLTSIMNTPEGRAELYKSFKLDGNDVVVTIKGYEDFKGSKTFPNGSVTVDSSSKHLIGCTGLMMYEQTYAQVALREPYFDFLPSLDESTTPFSLMQRLRGGYENEAMSELLGLEDLGKLPITNPYKDNKKSTVLFSISNPNNDAAKVKAYLTQYAGKKNYILQCGTVPKDKEAVESSLLKEYNLVSSHAYNIVGYDAATETVKITNPHNSSVVTEIPLSELVKYMRAIVITNLNE